MKPIRFPLLNKKEEKELYNSLHFMNISELKNVCKQLSLAATGKKGDLINKIMVFIKTGEVVPDKKFPEQSLAKNHPARTVHENDLILYGAYKNDAKTRAFFKKLIGQHFHFTAFGIDWLNERWLAGMPPTYKEFAHYWIEETARRKKVKKTPKKEWAFITFLQEVSSSHPFLTKKELLQAWKKIRLEKKQHAQKIINHVNHYLKRK